MYKGGVLMTETYQADLPPVLYSCSGCSDAGELADRTARALSNRGLGKMSCLAGLAAGRKNFIREAEKAERIWVVDGCPIACASAVVEQRGFAHKAVVSRLDKLGFKKHSIGPSAPHLEKAERVVADDLLSKTPKFQTAR